MKAKQLSVLILVSLAMSCRSGVKIEDGTLADTAVPAGVNPETDTNDPDDADEDEDSNEQDEDDEDDKPDDWEDGDKPDDDDNWGFSDCAEDFDPTLPCEGGPEQTVCIYEDTVWWCQDGVWMNENDKPE